MPDRTQSNSVIFHHPGPVIADGKSGSQVRPYRLLDAFYKSGFEVEAVVGYGAERRRAINRIIADLAKGRRFEFLYSEARSIPTLLTERNRLPAYPILDFRFLSRIRAAKIPLGLFYRDVFWRFQAYRTMLPLAGRMLTVPLYWYDWWWYRHVVDHLFLPSRGMAAHLPTAWPASRISALPPGCIPTGREHLQVSKHDKSRNLQLLYVGGIQPPTYDLRPLFECVAQVGSLRLIVCCRLDEWVKWQDYYAHLVCDRVEVVHVFGNALANLYLDADVFALLRSPDAYLDFAVPVKLFEAIGYALPIVTTAGTEAARLVSEQDLGWVVASPSELAALLTKIAEDRDLVREKAASVLLAAQQQSWRSRVHEIAKQLERYQTRTRRDATRQ